MTQEFEKWCSFENLGVSPDLNASHVKAAKAAWQASREQLKAKLLSDEMVNIIIGKMSDVCAIEFRYEGNASLGNLNRFHIEKLAKAALEAIVREI